MNQKAKHRAFKLFFVSGLGNLLAPGFWYLWAHDHPSRVCGLIISMLVLLHMFAGFIATIVSLIAIRLPELLSLSALYLTNLVLVVVFHSKVAHQMALWVHWSYVAAALILAVRHFATVQPSDSSNSDEVVSTARRKAVMNGLEAYTTKWYRVRIILHLVLGGALVFFLLLLSLSFVVPGLMAKGVGVLFLAGAALCFFVMVLPLIGILDWSEPEFILSDQGLWVRGILVTWDNVKEANIISTRTLHGAQGTQSETELLYMNWAAKAPLALREELKLQAGRRMKGHISTMGQGVPNLKNCIIAVPLKGVTITFEQLDQFLRLHDVTLHRRTLVQIQEFYKQLKEDKTVEFDKKHHGALARNEVRPSSGLLEVQGFINRLGVFSRSRSIWIERIGTRGLNWAAAFFVAACVFVMVSGSLHLDGKLGFNPSQLGTLAVWVLLLAFLGINGFGLLYKSIEQLRSTKRQPTVQGWIYFGMVVLIGIFFTFWFFQLAAKLFHRIVIVRH